MPSDDAPQLPQSELIEGVSVPGDVPDLRRDAIEEAAETSLEARARIRRLDAIEAAADPSFSRGDGRPPIQEQ